MSENKEEISETTRYWRRFVPWSVFLAVIALALFIHRCSSKPQPIPRSLSAVEVPPKDSAPAPRETTATVPRVNAVPVTIPHKKRSIENRPAAAAQSAPAVPDTLPYVYASPWGGRHFDSVTVSLHCLENCEILYSFEDSANLLRYEGPMTFRTHTVLWFLGVSKQGNRTDPIRLEYVIEKKPNPCAQGMMPVSLRGRDVCMDIFEWPDREDAKPRAMVSQGEAANLCREAGKRLCTLDEWRAGCQGPQQSRYPYGADYNERYCPAQQADPARSGQFPACRSYYGLYDMTGGLWEWTSTVNPDHDDFYFAAGGNWETAAQATCGMAKYSFYPQNTYPAVGFRCCAEAK